jgi:4-hydroxybenzoate polyprenyltransferase
MEKFLQKNGRLLLWLLTGMVILSILKVNPTFAVLVLIGLGGFYGYQYFMKRKNN